MVPPVRLWNEEDRIETMARDNVTLVRTDYWRMITDETYLQSCEVATGVQGPTEMFTITNKVLLDEIIARETGFLDGHVELSISTFKMYNYIGISLSVCMMFSVVTKVIFNWKAKIPMQLDKWSTADVQCATINIFCNFALQLISPDDILSGEKLPYNFLMLMIVFITWYRVIMIMYVQEKFSVLLMTIAKMMTAGMNFFMMLIYYFLIMAMVFLAIFGDELPATYENIFETVRLMFDYLMGSYSWLTLDSGFMDLMHTFFLILHVYLANIFMLNYLVAILSDVFGAMVELSFFAFYTNLYMFIERYAIAFKDTNGYYELVLHPPPINILLVMVLPSIFAPD
jgi:hypothetical protein